MARLFLPTLIVCSLSQASLIADPNIWVKNPSKQLLEQTPGLVHETFRSAAMDATVGYCVVLPPGYADSEQRYPVVYWLHGGGGNECSSVFTSQAWRDLCQVGLIGEVILVYPNGFRSGYMDHHDGKVMVETMITGELIPRIDERFRTIASRAGRAVHGFSMGASGALKFAIKYPHLFCAAVAYGGGAIDLERSQSPFILNILKRNLDSDPDLIRQNNTYHFLAKNHEVVRRNGTGFLFICGEDDSWLGSATAFRAALRDRQIPCRLITVPGVGHDLPSLSARIGAAAAMFQDRIFRLPPSGPPHAAADKAVTFNDAYYSSAEGRKQPFQLTLPPDYSLDQEYPLLVQVFGSASMLPTLQRPFIRVRPSGRGVWGYRSMSRYDVMQVIDHAKLHYSVDEERIYMTGTSSGATGIMHVAAHRPEVFAGLVPLVAFGNDLPLKNFRNLPMRCEHGINDWTSAIGNVRVQFQKLEQMGYDAVLNEHASAGHGIRVPPARTMDWLLSLKRNPSPRHIVYSCEHPRDGRAYWIRIQTFLDPHAVASVDAKVDGNTIHVATQNVKRLTLDCSNSAVQGTQRLIVDGADLNINRRNGQHHLTITRSDNWAQESKAAHTKQGRRAYGAGAAANLFQGEALLVVYGTEGDEAENVFLRQAANQLARTGGPEFKPANVQFPIRPDTDVSDLRLQDHNLLLIGTPETNSCLRDLAPDLPYTIENNLLIAEPRQPLDLENSVLSFHFFNPASPQRLIYIVSPYLSEDQRDRFLRNPRKFLAGSAGFKMIDQPDLLVRDIDLRIRREMQCDADWKLITPDGQDTPIPSGFSDRVNLAMAHGKVMRRTADVDFAFWWGPQDKGLFGGYDFNWLPTFDSKTYTLADFSIRRRETETMTAELPGAELIEIFDRWIATSELVTWPTVKKDDIKTGQRYSIVIPMDLVPKLGRRRKVLQNVLPGPAIMPHQVAAEVFALASRQRP